MGPGPPALALATKDPGDTLDYVFDICEALAGNDGDAIATLDVAIYPDNPGDLTLQSSSADGDQAILWLTGGFAGTIYAVTVTVSTNSGRFLNRTVSLPVLSLATPPVSQSDIITETGVPITTQTDQPITAS